MSSGSPVIFRSGLSSYPNGGCGTTVSDSTCKLGAVTRAGMTRLSTGRKTNRRSVAKTTPRLTKRGAEGCRIRKMHAYALGLQEPSNIITSRWVFRTTHNVDNLNSRSRSDR